MIVTVIRGTAHLNSALERAGERSRVPAWEMLRISDAESSYPAWSLDITLAKQCFLGKPLEEMSTRVKVDD